MLKMNQLYIQFMYIYWFKMSAEVLVNIFMSISQCCAIL